MVATDQKSIIDIMARENLAPQTQILNCSQACNQTVNKRDETPYPIQHQIGILRF